MNKILITYADENMQTSQKLCLKSAGEKAGIVTSYGFGPHNIDYDFTKVNKDILTKEQRGGGKGFWLWKPYFCHMAVQHSSVGDYVIYSDSGIEFIKPIDCLIEMMQNQGFDIFLFGNNHNHFEWCKKEVAQHMLCMSDAQIKVPGLFKEQVQASVMIFKVNIFTRDFCKRWLMWSQIPGFINDISAFQQLPNYKDHRNDQSILTNLAIAENIKLHWWPTQYGYCIRDKYPNDKYEQLFYHHRYRESDWENNGLTIEQFMQKPKN